MKVRLLLKQVPELALWLYYVQQLIIMQFYIHGIQMEASWNLLIMLRSKQLVRYYQSILINIGKL